MGSSEEYPFVPKSNARLRPGQFWAIPLSDGRFACGRVLRVDETRSYGARTTFVAGLLDWIGEEPPTAESLAGAGTLEIGKAHIRTIQSSGLGIIGERPLEADGIVAPEEIRTFWGTTYPLLRAERRFLEGDPPPKWGRREVKSPLTPEMLQPMTQPNAVVQFHSKLTDGDFRRLAEWLHGHPNYILRAYGSYDGTITDLEFLRFFPFLTRFAADALYHSLQSLEGLRHLPEDLQELGIGQTKKRLDLAILGRFRDLRSLYLEGQTRGIEIISSLPTIEELTLRSITLPDLSLLVPLKSLKALMIKPGGTSDLALLPEVGALRYLELWMIKGLTDISAIGRLPHLRYLFLQALRRVESIPDLGADTELRRIHLETMKGLRDLRPLATAPLLEELWLIDMPQLQPDDLRPLIGLPTLRAVWAGLGSLRKNEAAQSFLGLPQPKGVKLGWHEL